MRVRARFTLSFASAAALLLIASSPLPAGDERVFSGPQPGEKLPPFVVEGVYDDAAGKRLDFVTEAQGGPLVLVFMHQLTRPSAAVMWCVMAYSESLADKGLHRGIVWLAADKSEAEQYLNQARASLALNGPVGISPDGGEGPGSLGLSRNVTLTIVMSRGGRVTANHALVQPSLTDLPQITADIAALIGTQPPTADQINALVAARSYGGQRGGEMMRRTAAGDDRLRQWLKAMAQDAATEDQAMQAAQAIERYTGDDPQRRQALARLAGYLIELGMGNEAAARQFARWAREGAPAESPRAQSADDGGLLRDMLRQIIQPDATEQQIQRVAQQVESHIGRDAARQRELLRIAQVVVERGYGNEHGRRQFKVWQEKYAD